MISFIVCSIDAEKLAALQKNVAQTIGVPYEFIAIDNSVAHNSLSLVYNMGAEKAQYPNLCFAHEDIIFVGQNWGANIIEKLVQAQTGVIGFAGAVCKTATMSGWAIDRKFNRCNFIEVVNNKRHTNQYNVINDFERVITLDGLCLFMRQDVWEETPFDSLTFDGFHLYDLDITMAISQKYENYVCQFPTVEHHSKGSFNKQWLLYSQLFHAKWEKHLPIYVNQVSDETIERNEKTINRRMTYMILKRGLMPPKQMWAMVKQVIRQQPLNASSYYLVYRYLRYAITARAKS